MHEPPNSPPDSTTASQYRNSAHPGDLVVTTPGDRESDPSAIARRQGNLFARSSEVAHLIDNASGHSRTTISSQLNLEVMDVNVQQPNSLLSSCSATVAHLAASEEADKSMGSRLVSTTSSKNALVTMTDRLGILCTCRQIFEEATSLIRGLHRFTIKQPRSLKEVFDSTMDYSYDREFEQDLIFPLILPHGGITLDFDLESHTLTRNTPALLYVDHWFRTWCMISCWGSTSLTVEMKSHDTESTFDNFTKLVTWLSQGYLFPLPRERDPEYGMTTIIMNFQMSKPTGLEKVRFGANSFLEAIRSSPFKRYALDTRVEVRVECSDSSTTNGTSLLDILAELLAFMNDMMVRHLELESSCCPRMWFDGLFRVRKAEFHQQGASSYALTSTKRLWRLSNEDPWYKREILHILDSEHLYPGQVTWFSDESTDIDKGTLLGSAIELAEVIIEFFQ